MWRIIAFLLIVNFSISAQQLTSMGEDVETPSSFTDPIGAPRGGMEKTSTGTLRCLILFINFTNDALPGDSWGVGEAEPDWAEELLDSAIPHNNIYTPLTLSDFFDRASGGDGMGNLGSFSVIGDYYSVLIPRPSSDKAAIEAALAILDNPGGLDVDFSLYDNWTWKVGNQYWEHSNTGDGFVDQMFIFFKSGTLTVPGDPGGEATLGGTYFVSNDNGAKVTSGSGSRIFKGYNNVPLQVVSGLAHEYGHHLFGVNQINGHWDGRNYNDGKSWTNTDWGNEGRLSLYSLMVTGDNGWMNGLEKFALGWLDPDTITTANPNYILGDTHVNGDAFILPIQYDTQGRLKEYYFVENLQTRYDYSNANPFLIYSIFGANINHGLLVYHVKSMNYAIWTDSDVNFLCADGLWNWYLSEGDTTPTYLPDDKIERLSPAYYTGYDERMFITISTSGYVFDKYVCLKSSDYQNHSYYQGPYYPRNDFLGDNEDLFRLNESNIFNRFSNPAAYASSGTPTNFGFEIKSFNSTTHEYTLNIQVNYSGVVAMPPSKPQILPITLAGFRNPKINWSANIESDLSYYKIYRKIGLGSWQFIATRYPPSTYYIDYEIEVSGLPSAKNIKYKIIAVDTQAKSSVYSDEVACKGLNELLPKKNSDEGESVEITSEYLLKQNYPNPFNPSTEITFSLKESANVKIVVFNSLGEEVVVLINSVIPAGYHSIEFKADNLPSGIYYYEMRAGDFREIKKMVLLR